jgi:Leg1
MRRSFLSRLLVVIKLLRVHVALGFWQGPRSPSVVAMILLHPPPMNSISANRTEDRDIVAEAKQRSMDWEAKQMGQGESSIMGRKSLEEWVRGTFYEQYWLQHVPTMAVSAPGKNGRASGRLRVNGYSFLGRMSIYKYLIQGNWEEITFGSASSSFQQLWGSMEAHEGHWLWSYGAQLDWQYRSGRLADPRNNPDFAIMIAHTEKDAVSIHSWWGYMNFMFSVAILLGAVGATNTIRNETVITVELDSYSQKLLQEDAACRECVAIWQDFFERVYPEFVHELLQLEEQRSTGSSLSPTVPDLRIAFQNQVWQAHTQIIEKALASHRATELLSILPEPEQRFGRGWACMVDILAASTFPTDLITLVTDGTGYLPFSVITDALFSEWQRLDKRQMDTRTFAEQCHERAVRTTHRLVDMDATTLRRICMFWRRVVRMDHRISRSMPKRVNCLVHGSFWTDQLRELVRVLLLFARP